MTCAARVQGLGVMAALVTPVYLFRSHNLLLIFKRNRVRLMAFDTFGYKFLLGVGNVPVRRHGFTARRRIVGCLGRDLIERPVARQAHVFLHLCVLGIFLRDYICQCKRTQNKNNDRNYPSFFHTLPQNLQIMSTASLPHPGRHTGTAVCKIATAFFEFFIEMRRSIRNYCRESWDSYSRPANCR